MLSVFRASQSTCLGLSNAEGMSGVEAQADRGNSFAHWDVHTWTRQCSRRLHLTGGKTGVIDAVLAQRREIPHR